MNTDTCLEMYALAYKDISKMVAEMRINQTLRMNEELLQALLKFDTLHHTLSAIIHAEIQSAIQNTQKHIKMFKKGDNKFSIHLLNENE